MLFTFCSNQSADCNERTDERERDEKKERKQGRPGVNDALFQGRIRTTEGSVARGVPFDSRSAPSTGRWRAHSSRARTSRPPRFLRVLSGYRKNRARPCSPDKITVERYRVGLRSVQSSGGRHNNSPLDLGSGESDGISAVPAFRGFRCVFLDTLRSKPYTQRCDLSAKLGPTRDERSSRAVQMQWLRKLQCLSARDA